MLWIQTAFIFLSSFVLLFYVQGNIFVPSFDEGLNIEGAGRLLAGQRPYVDFFGHASPGAYLSQALVLAVAGQTMFSARFLVLFYQSLQIGLLFWMVARFASPKAAYTAVIVYSLTQTANIGQLTAHHRWDSSTLSLLSIATTLWAIERPHRFVWWALSGLAAVSAAIATPTAALMGCATVGWLLLTLRWRETGSYLCGVAAGAGAVLFWLVSIDALTGGRFGGYIGFLGFMKDNYAEGNTVSFGFVPGGWFGLVSGRSPVEMIIQIVVVLCLAIPVWAPFVAMAGWGWWILRGGADLPVAQSTAWYLIACQVAMLVFPLPRPDLSHIMYSCAFSCALVAVWMDRMMPRKLAVTGALVMVLGSLGFLGQRLNTLRDTTTLETAIGAVAVPNYYVSDIRLLQSHIGKGDTALVYPFMPNVGYLLQARNPTAFLFMQPGMMKDKEERQFLEDLIRTRPRWIVLFPWSRALFLGMFPSASRLSHRFPKIDAFFEENYVVRAKGAGLQFELLELR